MTEDRRRAPLSSELAQRVVDLIAPTISHNINVMDEHGTIIACMEPGRVGSLHRGAQRVIAERRSVLVTVPEPGTSDRPGANEPLMIDGELRGVVGVTGNPGRWRTWPGWSRSPSSCSSPRNTSRTR